MTSTTRVRKSDKYYAKEMFDNFDGKYFQHQSGLLSLAHFLIDEYQHAIEKTNFANNLENYPMGYKLKRAKNATFMDAIDIYLFLFCPFIPWAIASPVCRNNEDQ